MNLTPLSATSAVHLHPEVSQATSSAESVRPSLEAKGPLMPRFRGAPQGVGAPATMVAFPSLLVLMRALGDAVGLLVSRRRADLKRVNGLRSADRIYNH
jgi:hypothetical protein